MESKVTWPLPLTLGRSLLQPLPGPQSAKPANFKQLYASCLPGNARGVDV